MDKTISQVIAQTLKAVGWTILALMAFWLMSDKIQPNFVQGRMILGVLMIATGYIIDIRDAVVRMAQRP